MKRNACNSTTSCLETGELRLRGRAKASAFQQLHTESLTRSSFHSEITFLVRTVFTFGLSRKTLNLAGDAGVLSLAHPVRVFRDFLSGVLHLLPQFGSSRVQIRIKVEAPCDFDEFLLRLPETLDRVASRLCRNCRRRL